jgi:hypothetical protein
VRRVGRVTRGKTAGNRLRRTDTWLLLDRSWIPPAGERPVVVDLGYGAEPTTTLETASRLAALDPLVMGIEIDRARVEAARRFAVPDRVVFRQGGFELGGLDRPVHAVRAMNVLRQYDETAYAASIALLRARLAANGVLLEGTCSPSGDRLTFHVIARSGHRLLVLAPGRGAPSELRAVLPKDLIHRCGPGSPLDRFFEHWDRLDTEARQRRLPRIPLAAGRLAAAGYPVDRRPAYVRRGLLVLRRHPAAWEAGPRSGVS